MSIRKSVLAAAVLLTVSAVPSFAGAGQWGLGYFRPEAPVGGRVWFNDKVAGDLGVGFQSVSPDVGDSQSAFVFDVGVPFVVAEAGAAKFFVRPGYTYASDDQGGTNNKTTQYWISGSLGVEYYFTDHFSVQAAHGVRYTSVDSDLNCKLTTFGSEAFGISNIGFHFYFGGK